MKHLTDTEFLSYKMSNWEAMPYSALLECPNGCSDVIGLKDNEATLIGWCETPNGFMMICECPVCFNKFRFHGTTTGRNSIERFRDAFELKLFLQEKKNI